MPSSSVRNNISSKIVRTDEFFEPEYNDFESVPQKQFTATAKGRASGFNPANRFDTQHTEKVFDDTWESGADIKVSTQFIPDHTKNILSKNDSPDIPYTYSINPYRGCEHGCIYCYARPSHEYLGYSSGMDFESKILVKYQAARLLEKVFQNPKWIPETICVSGNTDCYQPAERNLKITRELLKVFLKYRNPVNMITKNFLITRDLDILSELAKWHLVEVVVSITTLDKELAHRMEPRTSIPEKRFEAIERLSAAGVPVGVLTAPIIPGLNDHEFPEILRLASEAGAQRAGYQVLRLPHALKDLFKDWLERNYPDKYNKVIHSIQDVRSGKLSESAFGKRMRGDGMMADHIARVFHTFERKYGLNKRRSPKTPAPFLRGGADQINLF